MSAADYEVGVIGAGPCGLLTALLLARRGIRCAIFERKPAPLLHPKAMAISRRTSEILQQIGLRDPMRTDDVRTRDFPIALWADSFVGEIYGVNERPPEDPAIAPYPGIHCPQTLTESVLLAALEHEPNASIFFDHEITHVEPTSDSVQLHGRRGESPTFRIACRYVVAADGAGSPTRRQLGIEAVGPGDQGHFLNVYFCAPYGPHFQSHAVLVHIIRREFFAFFVSVNGDDLWLMHHFLQAGEQPSDYPAEKLAAIVREASGVPGVPVEILSVSPWVMSPKVAAKFRAGPVLLTGDAGARLSPAGGLGMNTGLQSAHNLAWKLAAVLRGAPDTLLDSYDAERRGHVMRTFEASGAIGSELGEIIQAGVFEGDFDRVRRLVAGSRRGDSRLGLDLGFRYERGAFLPENAPEESAGTDRYRPDAAPGGRAPHLWLTEGDRRFSALDLFGASFVLLVAGPAASWRAAVKADALFGGFYLEVFEIGGPDGFGDPDGRFLELYGLDPDGAVLVRPDGVVGWRSKDAAPDQLSPALATILAGGR